jgi:hypothetical protein
MSVSAVSVEFSDQVYPVGAEVEFKDQVPPVKPLAALMSVIGEE